MLNSNFQDGQYPNNLEYVMAMILFCFSSRGRNDCYEKIADMEKETDLNAQKEGKTLCIFT